MWAEHLTMPALGTAFLWAMVIGGLGVLAAKRLHVAAVAVYGDEQRLPVLRGARTCFVLWFVPVVVWLLASVSLSGVQVGGWLVFVSLLGLLALIDARTGLLPNELTLLLLGTGLAWQAVTRPTADLMFLPPAEHCWGVVLGWLVLTALNHGHERWRGSTAIGQGDARLFGGIGAWLGMHALPAVWVMACLTMLLYLMLQLLVTRRWQCHVAFGPFLAVGASLAMWGQMMSGFDIR
jgi:leader peptidase (prepilin peptidase)/N-methyltransferase